MFFEIIKWSIISLILIILVHYLFIFFKDNLTIPKTKDLVTKPLEKYKVMEDIIINNNISSTNKVIDNNILNNEKIGTTQISNLDLNNIDNVDNNMKNELKQFFSNLNDL